MATTTDPIGIFDSGVGGLSIAAAMRELLPSESLLYYADRAHFPYGSRSEQEVRLLAQAAAQFLLGQGAKLIVVACNTASSVALASLRMSVPVPFVGVVPGIKPGSAGSSKAKVGVLATEATFHTKVFTDLLSHFAQGVEVQCQVCPDLVALVEAGEVDSERVEAQLRRYVEPFLRAGIDTLVLGCTHYSFLLPAIQRVAGPDILVVDTARPVALQVQRVLASADLLRDGGGPGQVCYYASADLEEFLSVAAQLWPEGGGGSP